MQQRATVVGLTLWSVPPPGYAANQLPQSKPGRRADQPCVKIERLEKQYIVSVRTLRSTKTRLEWVLGTPAGIDCTPLASGAPNHSPLAPLTGTLVSVRECAVTLARAGLDASHTD